MILKNNNLCLYVLLSFSLNVVAQYKTSGKEFNKDYFYKYHNQGFFLSYLWMDSDHASSMDPRFSFIGDYSNSDHTFGVQITAIENMKLTALVFPSGLNNKPKGVYVGMQFVDQDVSKQTGHYNDNNTPNVWDDDFISFKGNDTITIKRDGTMRFNDKLLVKVHRVSQTTGKKAPKIPEAHILFLNDLNNLTATTNVFKYRGHKGMVRNLEAPLTNNGTLHTSRYQLPSDKSDLPRDTVDDFISPGDYDIYATVPITGQEHSYAHLEFMVPYVPDVHNTIINPYGENKTSHQHRGNSGVYVGIDKEIQIIDNYGNIVQPGNDKNAVSLSGENKRADVVVSFPPLQWQTIDSKIEPDPKHADYVLWTVWHNGVKVHDKYRVNIKGKRMDAIRLQYHYDNVQWRNVWYVTKNDFLGWDAGLDTFPLIVENE